MLTAWGLASAFGPLLLARMRETSGSYRSGIRMIAVALVVSIVLPIFVLKRPRQKREPVAQH